MNIYVPLKREASYCSADEKWRTAIWLAKPKSLRFEAGEMGGHGPLGWLGRKVMLDGHLVKENCGRESPGRLTDHHLTEFRPNFRPPIRLQRCEEHQYFLVR